MKRIHPSGSQKRKLKKAKTEEANTLAGSLSKYLEKKGDVVEEINQTVESETNIQIIDVETTNIGEKSTKCDINKNSDESDTEKQDDITNKLMKSTGEESEENVAPNIEFLSSNHAAHWPIPVP